MKALTTILFVFLIVLLCFTFGCQSQQSHEFNKNSKVSNVSWVPTGTGFYRPEYKP